MAEEESCFSGGQSSKDCMPGLLLDKVERARVQPYIGLPGKENRSH